jgi:amino acid adenylation domain-containing protein/non-ribosomal peptide synthase protein (TIGR01720 family)
MNRIEDFLSYLRDQDIELWVDGDRLRCNAPKGALTQDLLNELARRKTEILAFFQEANQTANLPYESIPLAPRNQNLPLSFAQQRLWFLAQLEGESGAYNQLHPLQITGSLQINILEQSLKEIVRRHEVLRTVFREVDGSPVQIVLPAMSVNILIVNLQAVPAEEHLAEVQRHAIQQAQQPFDLANGPLLRVTLLQLGEESYVLMLTTHHIICDGWSMRILSQEFFALYAAYSQGEPSPLPELPIQYADFAHWQREWLQGQVLSAQLNYWQQQLAGSPPLLQLPTDRVRPPVQSFRGAQQHGDINKEMTHQLKSLSQRYGTTLFMTVFAAFVTLLARYTGVQDIVVGSPIANRNRREIEPLIGFFVNTLVLRINLEGNLSFTELLMRVRQVTLDAYKHQDLPFEKLVESLQLERSLSYHPLCQVILGWQNAPMEQLQLSGMTLTPLRVETGTAKFDLFLSIEETELGLLASWEYNSDLFDETTITRMRGHFQNLLAAIVANPTERISEFPLLTPSERQQLVVEWNNTHSDYPQHQCIHQLFEAQVKRTPDAVAVVYQNQQLTYRELNARANQLAHYLQKLGVEPEMLVGICIERSVEMVVGLLGILKAGGAYVPLDQTYPQERFAFMLNDAQLRVVLTQQRLIEKLYKCQANVVCIDTNSSAIDKQSEENLKTTITSDNLAYVIYTSGSTGLPKGVAVPHKAVNRLVCNTNYVKLAPTDKIGQAANTSFDAVTFEIWGALLNGAQLVGISKDIIFSPQDFAFQIQQKGISVLFLTTALFQQIARDAPQAFASLRSLLFGGETVDTNWVKKILKNGSPKQLIHVYGPTESTTFSSYYCVQELPESETSIPIGCPITNTQIYLLDANLDPVPISVIGELYIGGDGLARCYLNRPELTAEKFIPNPFDNLKGSRLYKTGDKAHYLPDGNIEFIGRIDNQVKIRGFRIELGEIESVLNTHPQIQQAVVIATENQPGNKRLVAYIVPKLDTVTTSELREFLKEKLPEYMVPSVFVIKETLPITPNGKLDRLALTKPEEEIIHSQEYVKARNSIEQTLANIWVEVLGVKQVSIHDNFFEIGGDSILSIQVVSRAKTKDIHISPKQVFQHQTIAELAKVANTTVIISAQQDLVTGEAPLTPIQHWFFAQITQEQHHYNQSVLLQVPCGIEPELLSITVEKLLSHHDGLRLRFPFNQSQLQQVNNGNESTIELEIVDLSSIPKDEQPQALTRKATQYQGSLNLITGPIIRVVLFNLGNNCDARLLIIIHHLAVDGLSWRILLSDLQTIYHQLQQKQPIQLPPKTTAFIDWAKILKSYAQSDILKQELNYWLNQPWSSRTPIPVDYPHTKPQNTVASALDVSRKLSVEQTRALLGEVNAAYNTQINDILLSALTQTLTQWTQGNSVLIDLEGHGREELFADVDLSRTVGWFTSLFPVLLQLPPLNQPSTVLKSIKEQLRGIPHRGIGYGILRYLCSDTSVTEQLQQIPTAEISFNYLGQFDSVQSQTGWKFAPESTGANHNSQQHRCYLLDINALIVEGQLQIDWTYSSHVHQRATVENLAQGYIQQLQSLIEHCQWEDNWGYTPTDFPEAHLTQSELDDLLAALKNPKLESIYLLSPMQQGMLFHSLYAPKSGVYFQQISLNLKGNVNVVALKNAWQKVVDRNSILRSLCVWENRPIPLAVVLKQVNLPWTYLDWRGLSPTQQQQQLEQLLLTEREQGFQLNSVPLMRCTLVQLSKDTFNFIWNFHHILMDGWCLPIIFKEVIAFYESEIQGKTCDLDSPRPYRDYISWLLSQDHPAAEKFWRQTLHGYCAPTPLVVDKLHTQSQQHDFNYNEQQLYLSAEVTQKLQSVAREHHLTLSTILQAAWALLLSRYSGEQQVVFGVTVSGRPASLSGVETMVGLFINTLPLRVQLPYEQQIIPWLQQIQQLVLELQHYSYTSLVDIQAWTDVPRGVPLFESIIVFENYPIDNSLSLSTSALQLSHVQVTEQTNYPLTVVVVPTDELLVKISYDTNRFDADTIARMLGHLQTLLSAIAENPFEKVSELPLLTKTEQHQLLVEWNDTPCEYPLDKSIHQLFESQVEKTPQSVALVYQEQRLTYYELNARANQLAHYLQSLGVKPEVLVGICVERSVEMVVGLLAILKAGGAYVPLDPHYPAERLSYMLHDSGVEVLLTQLDLLSSLPSSAAQTVCLDQDWAVIEQQNQCNLNTGVSSDNLAYVIYTSGSTGQPKGVLVEQKNVVRLFAATQSWYNFNENDVWTNFHSIAFDFSVWEIWGALIYGGRLVVVPYWISREPQSFHKLLCQEKVTVLNQTPSAFRQLISVPESENKQSKLNLRLVIFGGEALEIQSLKSWFEQYGEESPQLVNMYGITETTVHVTYRPLKINDRLSSGSVIGRPIPDLKMYILDDNLQPVPIGVTGQMYVGGDGLARGYLNRPELTSQRFISNPYGEGRLYKTGDLACYLPDGNIEFLGRVDNQVKIRGFRIELGEIEATLNAHPQVQQAIVIARVDIPGNKRLVAYVVTQDDSINSNQLRVDLKQKLPEYMIPSAFVFLESFPLTPNGKINRNTLPAPDGEITRTDEYIPPNTEVEVILTNIWQEVLLKEKIGIHDNFFELGGHSLLATQVISELRDAFEVELPLRTLFEAPTVAELSDRIETLQWAKQQLPASQTDKTSDYKKGRL